MSDTDTYRAAIVRKLRAEADRIEAGGAPFCYAIRCDENDSTTVEAFHNVAEARELLTVEVHGDFVRGRVHGGVSDVYDGV